MDSSPPFWLNRNYPPDLSGLGKGSQVFLEDDDDDFKSNG